MIHREDTVTRDRRRPAPTVFKTERERTTTTTAVGVGGGAPPRLRRKITHHHLAARRSIIVCVVLTKGTKNTPNNLRTPPQRLSASRVVNATYVHTPLWSLFFSTTPKKTAQQSQSLRRSGETLLCCARPPSHRPKQQTPLSLWLDSTQASVSYDAERKRAWG